MRRTSFHNFPSLTVASTFQPAHTTIAPLFGRSALEPCLRSGFPSPSISCAVISRSGSSVSRYLGHIIWRTAIQRHRDSLRRTCSSGLSYLPSERGFVTRLRTIVSLPFSVVFFDTPLLLGRSTFYFRTQGHRSLFTGH